MDPCQEREPQVINHEMIARCLEEQGLKGELGRLAREEGIPWDEVTHIRLEFMKILRIDHLWVLPALTELSLSSNLIEKIENIETLVNLKHLDLSFNKITKIENLEDLVNLEILNLYSNLIECVENMDTLKGLIIFSIGRNRIKEKKEVLYLRRFKNLKSVNLAGNPIAEMDNFRIFVATFLPQILYYEYMLIESSERDMGEFNYSREIKELEMIEAGTKEQEEKLEAEATEAALNSESFVEFLGTDHLFKQMFDHDPDGKAFCSINDEASEYHNEFSTTFLALCMQIFETGQEQYKARKEEVNQFTQVTEGAKYDNQQESIRILEDFVQLKEKLFRQIDSNKQLYKAGELSFQEYTALVKKYKASYEDKIKQTWKVLMNLEVILYEQMEEINQVFEQSVTEMITNFIEMAQGYFSHMRAAEGTYTEQIGELMMRLQTNFVIAPESILIPPETEHYFQDRDALNNAITSSHDLHLLIIDNREDRLIRRAKTWLNNLVNDLQKNEIKRNREKVLEITHYLDIQKEEFDIQSTLQEIVVEL